MRRVPIDPEFGSPIAMLKNKSVALFENGTLGTYRIDNQTDGLESSKYRFYYNHVSELSHIKLTNKEEPPRLARILSKMSTQLMITAFVSILLLLVYVYSIEASELPLIEKLPHIVSVILGWIILITIVFFELMVVEIATPSSSVSRTMQIHLIHRTEPFVIVEDERSFNFQLAQFHNLLTRLILIATMLDIPEKTTLYGDFISIVLVVTFVNALIYLLGVPIFAYFFVVKGMHRFQKVPNLNLDDFHEQLLIKTNHAKSELIAQNDKTLNELLSGDETSTLEFKGSVWTTYNKKSYEKIDSQSNKNFQLQDAVVKSIAAFLNTDGGTLLIGVKDRPHLQNEPIVGIENDFKWTKTLDIEGFRHSLLQLLDDAFGDPSISKIYLRISYPKINSKHICRVDVDPLPRIPNGELWVKTKTMGNEEFFYRASDTSTHASAKSALRYIRHHFEGYSNSDLKEK